MPPTLKTLNPDDTTRLLDYLKTQAYVYQAARRNNRGHLMALLMLDAGLRVGELVQLRIVDLTFDHTAVTSLLVRSETTKTNTSRVIPLTQRLRTSIRETTFPCINDNGDPRWTFAFCAHRPGKHISTRSVQALIRKAGHASLSRRVTPHMLRHTFATRLMQRANIRIVQELLGHKSLQSTQVYTHPNSDDLTNAINSLEG